MEIILLPLYYLYRHFELENRESNGGTVDQTTRFITATRLTYIMILNVAFPFTGIIYAIHQLWRTDVETELSQEEIAALPIPVVLPQGLDDKTYLSYQLLKKNSFVLRWFPKIMLSEDEAVDMFLHMNIKRIPVNSDGTKTQIDLRSLMLIEY